MILDKIETTDTLKKYLLSILLIFCGGIIAQAQDDGFFVPYPNIGDTTYYYEVGNSESIKFEMFETPQGYYMDQTLAPCYIKSYTDEIGENTFIWRRGIQEYHFNGSGNRMEFEYAVVKDVFKNTWARMELNERPKIFNDISSMSTYRTMDLTGSYSYQVDYLEEDIQNILKGTGATALWVSFALNVKYERLGTTKVILPIEDTNSLTLKSTEFYIPTGFQIFVDGSWQKIGGDIQMAILDKFVPVTVPKLHYIDNGQKREVAQINIDPTDKDRFIASHYMYRDAFKYLTKCNEEGGIYLFPNPSYGAFNIKMYNYPEGEYRINIYNIVGKLMRSETLSKEGEKMIPIVLHGIQKGTYFYSIEDKFGNRLDTRRLSIMGL